MTEYDALMKSALARIAPQADGTSAWDDVLQRANRSRPPSRAKRRLVAALAASLAIGAVLAATPLGHAIAGGAFDELSGWIESAPGGPAPAEEQRLLREENARAAAPVPANTELGLLTSKVLDGVRFDLLGFRDRGSLCLRLRSSAGQGAPIIKASADCVSVELLVDLRKPLAVVAAADPFPRSRSGLVALYGLAADGVNAVELRSESGIHRVAVTNNAYVYLYRGEAPRLSNDRLEYKSDVPFKAVALDVDGNALGAVKIMSLKRGYPAAPSVSELPGPSAVERRSGPIRVSWLDHGEDRGDTYAWPSLDGRAQYGLPHMRMFQPSPSTSMRVLVSGPRRLGQPSETGYCLTNVWPLSPRPTMFMCGTPHRSGPILLATATAVPFDAQFPIYYGLVADDVASLELFLSNGARESIPIVDNVFALQAAAADPAKLVAYDREHRVLGVQVVSLS